MIAMHPFIASTLRPLILLLLSQLVCAGCRSVDHVARVAEFREQAMDGNPEAQFQLGVAYDMGRGVEQDFGRALEWYRMAADSDHDQAQYSVGSMLQAGLGVEQSDVLAVTWYRLAADQGNPEAMNSLGLMYDLGNGVSEDNVVAAGLYEQASDLGSGRGMLNLGVLLWQGQSGVSQDLIEAYKWIDLARWISGTSSDEQLKWTSRGALEQLAGELANEQIAEAGRRAKIWSAAFLERMKTAE